MKAAPTKANVLKVMAIALPMFTAGVGTAVVGTGLLAFSAPAAHAAKQQQVSPKVGKPLAEAQGLAKAKKFKEAMAKVKEAQAISGKTAYEEGVVNEMLAYVALNLGDYATAAKAYEETVNANAVPPEQMKPRLEAIIKLNYQGKNFAKV